MAAAVNSAAPKVPRLTSTASGAAVINVARVGGEALAGKLLAFERGQRALLYKKVGQPQTVLGSPPASLAVEQHLAVLAGRLSRPAISSTREAVSAPGFR